MDLRKSKKSRSAHYSERNTIYALWITAYAMMFVGAAIFLGTIAHEFFVK
jgi:hypothetical protein